MLFWDLITSPGDSAKVTSLYQWFLMLTMHQNPLQGFPKQVSGPSPPRVWFRRSAGGLWEFTFLLGSQYRHSRSGTTPKTDALLCTSPGPVMIPLKTRIPFLSVYSVNISVISTSHLSEVCYCRDHVQRLGTQFTSTGMNKNLFSAIWHFVTCKWKVRIWAYSLLFKRPGIVLTVKPPSKAALRTSSRQLAVTKLKSCRTLPGISSRSFSFLWGIMTRFNPALCAASTLSLIPPT